MSQGTEEKFVTLIQDNAGIIYKVIHLYIDDLEDRKDVYQEILIQSWKSYGNFKANSKFSTWLYKVALNTVLTWHKKETKRNAVKADIPISTAPEEADNSVKDQLYLLVKQLEEIDRMIMSLHLDGYQNIEIAEITGMKVNHINVKLFRLKNTIVEQLKKYTNGHI